MGDDYDEVRDIDLTTHLVIPDSHANPQYNNDRADLLGKLILDLRPDVVINLGDMWDFPSLATYDKGKKSFWGKTYLKDLESGLEFDDRIWSPIKKAKKRRPYSIFIEGNHENRVKKAIELQSELDGIISFDQLELDRNYDEVVEYSGDTPGVTEVSGINYSHFFISGILGRPISGEHAAYQLITKEFSSCTCGHSHVLSFSSKTTAQGKRINGLVAGVYQDYNSDWAGERNRLWWRGVVIKRNVESGNYDPEFVSLEQLRKYYGN